MANVNQPFGFRMLQRSQDATPVFSLGMDPLKFAAGYATKVAKGDILVRLATGYVAASVAPLTITGIGLAVGIFEGCQYLSASQGKRVVSSFYPGGDAVGDIDVQYTPLAGYEGARMVVQANAGPITFADIGLNADMVYTAPTTYGSWGRSGVTLGAPAAAGVVLPFKIMGLWSQYQGKNMANNPAAGGVDNASQFNWVVVEFNAMSNTSV